MLLHFSDGVAEQVPAEAGPIAAGLLGAIKSGVGRADQRLRRPVAAIAAGRHAQADGDLKNAVGSIDRLVTDGRPKTLGAAQRIRPFATGQDEEELLAAVAANGVVG